MQSFFRAPLQFASVLDIKDKQKSLPLAIVSLYSWHLHARTFSHFRLRIIEKGDKATLGLIRYAEQLGCEVQCIKPWEFGLKNLMANKLLAFEPPPTPYLGLIDSDVFFTPKTHGLFFEFLGLHDLLIRAVDVKRIKIEQWESIKTHLGVEPLRYTPYMQKKLAAYKKKEAPHAINKKISWYDTYGYFNAGIIFARSDKINRLKKTWLHYLMETRLLAEKNLVVPDNIIDCDQAALALAIGKLVRANELRLKRMDPRFNFTHSLWNCTDTTFKHLGLIHATGSAAGNFNTSCNPDDTFCIRSDMNPDMRNYLNHLAHKAFSHYQNVRTA